MKIRQNILEHISRYRETEGIADISQPSLNISPIWIPIISDEVTKS
jgi:hypothetical protein